MDRANDGVSSRRGGGGGAETRRWTKLSQRKRVVLSISKLRTSPSHLWQWRDSGKEVHSQRCRAAMRCDALRGRDGFVGGLGPAAWGCVGGGASQRSLPPTPGPALGSSGPAGPLAPGLAPGDLAFFRAVFSSHPRCCAAQCPSRHLHFALFALVQVDSTFSDVPILHSPRPRPALHTLTPHFANSCILAIIDCVPMQPKLQSDPPST